MTNVEGVNFADVDKLKKLITLLPLIEIRAVQHPECVHNLNRLEAANKGDSQEIKTMSINNSIRQ